MQSCLLNLIVSIKKQISVRLISYCTILGTYIDSLLIEGSVGTRKHRLIEVGNRAIVANLTTWAILLLFLISIGCFAMERPVGGVRVTILIINEWSWCRARIWLVAREGAEVSPLSVIIIAGSLPVIFVLIRFAFLELHTTVLINDHSWISLRVLMILREVQRLRLLELWMSLGVFYFLIFRNTLRFRH